MDDCVIRSSLLSTFSSQTSSTRVRRTPFGSRFSSESSPSFTGLRAPARQPPSLKSSCRFHVQRRCWVGQVLVNLSLWMLRAWFLLQLLFSVELCRCSLAPLTKSPWAKFWEQMAIFLVLICFTEFSNCANHYVSTSKGLTISTFMPDWDIFSVFTCFAR